MNSNEAIATCLRSISQGVKVNTYQLQHRTDLIYQKLNRENNPNSNSFEDHEVFELAIIQAFKELISEIIIQSESRHHKQQVFPAGFLAQQVVGQALPLQLVAHQLQPPVQVGGLA